MEYDWRPDEIAKLHAQPGTPVENNEGLHLVSSVRSLGIDGAIAQFKKLAEPPTEARITSWGYTLLRSGNVDEGVDTFRLLAALFPASANAMDSLSEALEVRRDPEGAKKAAEESLARLGKDQTISEERRQILRNASSSRLARLSGAPASKLCFTCPPCSSPCDEVGYLEEGRCPGCIMQLVERAH
jgi:hypothetical protein